MEEVAARGNALDRHALSERFNANDAFVCVELVNIFAVLEIFEDSNEILHGELLDNLELSLQVGFILLFVFFTTLTFLLRLLPSLEGPHELPNTLHTNGIIIPLAALIF